MPRRRTRQAARSRERAAPRAGDPRWISRVFWLGVVAVAAYFSWREVAVPAMSEVGFRRVEAHAALIRAAAEEFRLDPNLLAGVALAESSGRVDAVSSVDALGMFQLMLPTARERAALLGLEPPAREDLLADPALGARLAASYLRWLSDRYGGRSEAALVAYNAGPGRLDGWIKSSGSYDAWRAARDAPGESQVLGYARKVQGYRERFAERGALAPPVCGPPVPPVLSTALPVYGPPLPPASDVDSPPAPPPATDR